MSNISGNGQRPVGQDSSRYTAQNNQTPQAPHRRRNGAQRQGDTGRAATQNSINNNLPELRAGRLVNIRPIDLSGLFGSRVTASNTFSEPAFLPHHIRRQQPNMEFVFENFENNNINNINDIAARLFNRIENIDQVNRINNTSQTPRNRLQLTAFDDLDVFQLTDQNVNDIEDNGRAFFIGEGESTSLSEALQRADAGDHLVFSDGWVFDYRELMEYAQHTPHSYVAPAGVIANPMTRAPVDLRANRLGDVVFGSAGLPRPQRIVRADLERFLQNRATTSQSAEATGQSAGASGQATDQTQESSSATPQAESLTRDTLPTLSRSASNSSIATADELDSQYQVASYIKRYHPNSRARQRRLETHLDNAFQREAAGEPTILTQGVRTRHGGQASALDIAAHYGRVTLIEDMLEMAENHHVELRSARREPEAAILARAERNQDRYDDNGLRIYGDVH